MLGRFQQAGGSVNWLERSDTKVSAIFSHPQGGDCTITWTLEDAKRAGLASGDQWKKYPRQMLAARAISEGVRSVYPSVVSGLYTPEEVQDFTPEKPMTQAVIAKPVFSKPALPEPKVEEAVIVEVPEDPVQTLINRMNEEGIDEDQVFGFLASKKALKNNEQYVFDLSQKMVTRLLEVWDEVKAFNKENK
jgi:hypothetical protein